MPRDLFASIEACYNRRPIHSAIGYITPEQADRKTEFPRSTVDWDTSQADDFRTRGGPWTIK
jgi:hypothetical protein